MKQTNKVMFNAKIVPVKPLNEEFTLCKCYVLALGKNRNRSYIGEKAVSDALSTIYNIPVVGHLYVDDNGDYHMGGHDMVLARDEDNKLIFKSICIPVGTVPYQENIHYEEIIDSKGNKSLYQVADVILWTGRCPDLYKAIYNDDIWFGQSMEINVKESKKLAEDENYEEITKFSYSALCLLGKSDDKDFHVEPCFPDARVEPYQFSIDNDEFINLMNEFKTKLTDCFQAIKTNKGGETKLTIEVCNSVLAEYSLSKEDINFEITEEMTEGELRAKLDQFVEESKSEETPEETAPETEESEKFEESEQETESTEETPETEQSTEETPEDTAEKQEEFEDKPEVEDKESDEDDTEDEESEEETETDDETEDSEDKTIKEDFGYNPETYEEKRRALCLAVNNLDVFEQVGCVYHCLCDLDDKYIYITRCIRVESKTYEDRVRTTYEFVDGEAILGETFEPVVHKWLTETEAEEIERQRKEYEELKSFYLTRIEEDRMNEYDAVLSQFSDLMGNEEFSAVLENKKGFESAEALKEKCFAIRGKSVVVTSTKKPDTKVRINYSEKETDESVYGGLFIKYPPRGKK